LPGSKICTNCCTRITTATHSSPTENIELIQDIPFESPEDKRQNLDPVLEILGVEGIEVNKFHSPEKPSMAVDKVGHAVKRAVKRKLFDA